MSRPAILALCAVALILVASIAWFVASPGGDAGGTDSGQPQTPRSLDAAEVADATEVATQAVRDTLRQQYVEAGAPRAIEMTGLRAKRDGEGNWYGKLWTATGTGMTADGGGFTWSAELKHEGGQWASVSPAEVSLKP